MEPVVLSPAFELAIPLAIRQALRIAAGAKFRITCFKNRIVLIPVQNIQQMRGFLRGIDTTIEREDDRL